MFNYNPKGLENINSIVKENHPDTEATRGFST
jgi:hypothetical protein